MCHGGKCAQHLDNQPWTWKAHGSNTASPGTLARRPESCILRIFVSDIYIRHMAGYAPLLHCLCSVEYTYSYPRSAPTKRVPLLDLQTTIYDLLLLFGVWKHRKWMAEKRRLRKRCVSLLVGSYVALPPRLSWGECLSGVCGGYVYCTFFIIGAVGRYFTDSIMYGLVVCACLQLANWREYIPWITQVTTLRSISR